MHIKFRTLAPVLLISTALLAGCQTAGRKTGAAEQAAPGQSASAPSTPQTGPSSPSTPATPSTAASVGFFVAQTEAAPGLTEVKLSDGSIYVQRVPVLTRADLTEAAALVDRQGKNFVGLRFSESGARKLTEVSTQNVGKLLVLVIDGQLVAAPRIAEPLNRGVLAFGVDSAQSASEIAARVRGDQAPAAATPAAPGAGTPVRQQ